MLIIQYVLILIQIIVVNVFIEKHLKKIIFLIKHKNHIQIILQQHIHLFYTNKLNNIKLIFLLLIIIMSSLNLMKTKDWLIEYDKITKFILEDNMLKENTLEELNIIKFEILKCANISKFNIQINELNIENILLKICWLTLSHFLYKNLYDYDKTIKICRDIFKKKNQDYGNAFVDYNVIGILVRMGDKINRIDNLKNNKPEVVDENIDDTFLDLFNYSVLAQCLINLS